ncbi:hypothetical protein GCM10010182_73070 [Actinomadura cremea]|nr:hypothetical protein GCM10010182_73070 [Actinomadura cremea]
MRYVAARFSVVSEGAEPVDVGAAQQPRLLDEPLPHVGVERPVLAEDLDRDGGVELRVVPQPDGREAARPEKAVDPVAAGCARCAHVSPG